MKKREETAKRRWKNLERCSSRDVEMQREATAQEKQQRGSSREAGKTEIQRQEEERRDVQEYLVAIGFFSCYPMLLR